MIGAIVGYLGCGKTAFLTYLAKLGAEKKERIYANYKLNMPHYEIMHPFQLVTVQKGRLLLDEFWLWASSIAPMRKLQQALAIVYTRSRKSGWDLYYTTQRYHNIHNRLRAITDIIFLPEPRPIDKDVPEYFEVTMVNPDTERKFTKKKIMFKLDEVKDLYDTNADIYGFEQIKEAAMKTLVTAGVAEFHRGAEEPEADHFFSEQ